MNSTPYTLLKLKLRHAKRSDKKHVLEFCINTFEWGDYIDKVWDHWYSDPNGHLIVAEYQNEREYRNKQHNKKLSTTIVAVSHVYVCPNRKRVWLEGIRVRPGYRRKSIATQLINKMLQDGIQNGAEEAAAIVSAKNNASQLLMKKNGFAVMSRWNHYIIYKIPEWSNALNNEFNVKFATLKDTNILYNYLKHSEIFRLGGQSYVEAWKWYPLNLSARNLEDLIKNKRVIAMEDNYFKISGLAIISRNNSVFQIGYLEAPNALTLSNLVKSTLRLLHFENKKYKAVELFSAQMSYTQLIMEELG